MDEEGAVSPLENAPWEYFLNAGADKLSFAPRDRNRMACPRGFFVAHQDAEPLPERPRQHGMSIAPLGAGRDGGRCALGAQEPPQESLRGSFARDRPASVEVVVLLLGGAEHG